MNEVTLKSTGHSKCVIFNKILDSDLPTEKLEKGDKFILGNRLKCTVGDIKVESGKDIDVVFSTKSISNRIVLSPVKTMDIIKKTGKRDSFKKLLLDNKVVKIANIPIKVSEYIDNREMLKNTYLKTIQGYKQLRYNVPPTQSLLSSKHFEDEGRDKISAKVNILLINRLVYTNLITALNFRLSALKYDYPYNGYVKSFAKNFPVIMKSSSKYIYQDTPILDLLNIKIGDSFWYDSREWVRDTKYSATSRGITYTFMYYGYKTDLIPAKVYNRVWDEVLSNVKLNLITEKEI